MADGSTSEFGFVLPDVTGSIDTWGNKLNVNFSAMDALISRLVPQGIICVWSGSEAGIPEGWAICDGENGTPDLRGKFVVASGGGYTLGQEGGEAEVTLQVEHLPVHDHPVTVGTDGGHSHGGTSNSAGSHAHTGSTNTAGSHSHSYTRYGNLDYGGTSTQAFRYSSTSTQTTGSAGNHSHSLSINSNGAHTHSFTTGTSGAHGHTASVSSTGGGQAHNNLPAYYALAYIMRL